MNQVRTGQGLAVGVAALLLAGVGCTAEPPVQIPSASASASAPSATSATAATEVPSASASASAPPGPSGASRSPSASGPAATRTPAGRRPTGPPPATTPVPPPSPGGVDRTVSAAPESSRPPVDIDQSAEADNGVSIDISRARAVKATAQLPGEVAGPAVALTLTVDNTSRRAVDLGTTVVTVLDSRGNPGGEISTPPARPLRGRLAPGRSAEGTYVFTIPENRRDPITVSVTLSGEVPVVVFRGDVP